jgi:hypothetical protein
MGKKKEELYKKPPITKLLSCLKKEMIFNVYLKPFFLNYIIADVIDGILSVRKKRDLVLKSGIRFVEKNQERAKSSSF